MTFCVSLIVLGLSGRAGDSTFPSQVYSPACKRDSMVNVRVEEVDGVFGEMVIPPPVVTGEPRL